MYCNKCGKKLPDDALFCPYCGSDVVIKETANELENNTDIAEKKTIISTPTSSVSNLQKKVKNQKSIFYVIIALICVGTIILASSILSSVSKSDLREYQIEGKVSTFVMDVPLAMEDAKLDKTPYKGQSYVYKRGASKNYACEIIGVKYKEIPKGYSMATAVNQTVKEMQGDFKIVTLENTNYVGTGAKKIIKRATMGEDDWSEVQVAAFVKHDEIWYVILTYSPSDKKAREVSDAMINSAHFK